MVATAAPASLRKKSVKSLAGGRDPPRPPEPQSGGLSLNICFRLIHSIRFATIKHTTLYTSIILSGQCTLYMMCGLKFSDYHDTFFHFHVTFLFLGVVVRRPRCRLQSAFPFRQMPRGSVDDNVVREATSNDTSTDDCVSSMHASVRACMGPFSPRLFVLLLHLDRCDYELTITWRLKRWSFVGPSQSPHPQTVVVVLCYVDVGPVVVLI